MNLEMTDDAVETEVERLDLRAGALERQADQADLHAGRAREQIEDIARRLDELEALSTRSVPPTAGARERIAELEGLRDDAFDELTDAQEDAVELRERAAGMRDRAAGLQRGAPGSGGAA
ncbi:hypothetical protein [Microbacterium soli]|uniref:Uncharacterized protein n=1 Tax=Microbacterium soli TaxID=446075 RepID=A0ABP7MYV7_9MICO